MMQVTEKVTTKSIKLVPISNSPKYYEVIVSFSIIKFYKFTVETLQ